MRTWIRLAALAAACLPAQGFSDGGVPGTLSLGVGTSARWLSMGRAGVADPLGTDNPTINPALLGGSAFPQISLLYASLYEQSSTQSLAVAYPLNESFSVALSAFRAASTSIATFDGMGAPMGTASFSRLETAISGSYRPLPELSLGLAVRGLALQAAGSSVSTGTADLGFSYLYDGIAGAGVKLENALVSQELARHLRAGATIRSRNGRASLNVDVESISSSKQMAAGVRAHAGGEIWVVPQVALRAGAQTGGFGGGIGMRFGSFAADYAGSVTEIGLSHWVSFAYRFDAAMATHSAASPSGAPRSTSSNRAKGDLLAAPTGIRVTKMGGIPILHWSSVSGAVGYNVYVSPDPGEEGTLFTPRTIRDTSVSMATLPPGVLVYVLVRPVDVRGIEGKPSNMTEVSTD